MAASKSGSFQNLSVGVLTPLPGLSGIFLNGTPQFQSPPNGVTLAPTATGLPSTDIANSLTVSRGTSSIRLAPNEVAVGNAVTATGARCTALGCNVSATAADTVVLGSACSATAAGAIAAGTNCSAEGAASICLGSFSSALGANSIAVGNNTIAQADGGIAIGVSNNVHAGDTDAVLIGRLCDSFAPQVLSFGSISAPLTICETGDEHLFKYTPGTAVANPAIADFMGGVLVYSVAAPLVMLLPSAASFAAAIGSPTGANTGIRCLIVNQTASTITISDAADPDWTLTDSTSHVIAANSSREVLILKSSAPGDSPETCVFYM